MLPVILHATFTLDTDPETAVNIDPDYARAYNEVPGLGWKIWIRDPDTKTNGGIHLFASRELAEAYLVMLRARMAARPDVTDFTATIYDVKVAASRETHGPIDAAANAATAAAGGREG
jgi:Putative mono-oxygenase ydhR